MASVKRFSSPIWTFSIPVLAGLLMAWGIVYLPFLVKLEHKAFVYPERFATESVLSYPFGQPEHFSIEIAHLSPKTISGSDFASHTIDKDTADILGSSQLTAANWTFLINSIHEAKAEHLIITEPLSWEDADELTLRALEHELSQLESFILAINLERGAIPQEFPGYLEASVIPSPEETNDEIPRINQINPLPSVEAPLYGFALLEQINHRENEKTLHLPMLARWDNKLLPSIELASLITSLDLSPSDVIYRPGLFLQLGENGLIIPIDKAGRTEIPFQEKLKTPSASEILESPEQTPALVSLTTPESSPHLLQLPYSLEFLHSRRNHGANWYGRLPFWKEAAFLAIFVLVLHRRKWWLTALAALAYFAFPFTNGEWLLFSPPLTAALAFALLKLRGTGPIREEATTVKTTEEPVIPSPEPEEEIIDAKEDAPAEALPKRHSSPARQPKSSKDRLAKKKRTH